MQQTAHSVRRTTPSTGRAELRGRYDCTVLSTIQPPTVGTERILSLRLSTSTGFVNSMSIYAPTLCSSPEVKDQFYEDLHAVTGMVPDSEPLFLLGDFNARVGGDKESWPACIGHFGVGRMNENGQRLLELCSYRKLSIRNTKLHHRVSWMHPRSHHLNQLELIIIRRAQLQSVLTTRSYHSADCDTDHSLVRSKVSHRPKKFHHSKRSGLPRINMATTVVPELCAQFAESVVTALEDQPAAETTEERWCLLRDTIHSRALSIFGKKERRNPDWYDESLPVMEPAISAKRDALKNYKREPSNNNLAPLRTARSEAHRTARYCANQYWLNLSQHSRGCGQGEHTRGL